MGKIFDDILEDVKKEASDISEQVRIICDQIYDEEKDKFKFLKYHPDGSNFMLTMETKGVLKREIGFLTLERDMGVYYATHRTLFEPNLKHIKEDDRIVYKVNKTWKINKTSPKKILKEFAKIYNHLQGK